MLDDDPSPVARGERGPATRRKINSVLDDVAARAAQPRGADLSAAELIRRGRTAVLPDPTPDDDTLDRLILDAIDRADGRGVAMRDLVEMLGRPRATVQMRCSTMARMDPPPIYADPPRGRGVRWYLSTRRVMAGTPNA